MNKRWDEFKKEIAKTKEPDENMINFSTWLMAWAIYILKGGDRPPHPHS